MKKNRNLMRDHTWQMPAVIRDSLPWRPNPFFRRQQAARPESGSRLPQSKGFAINHDILSRS
jgi:hypothetical protein